MTKEMAEAMKGPAGPIARRLTEAALAEFDRWARHYGEGSDYEAWLALWDVRALMLDYLPGTFLTELTAMQLTGDIEVKGADDE